MIHPTRTTGSGAESERASDHQLSRRDSCTYLLCTPYGVRRRPALAPTPPNARLTISSRFTTP